MDGEKQEPKYQLSITTAIYDEEKKLFSDRETGETYSFDPKKNVLYAGKTIYQKN